MGYKGGICLPKDKLIDFNEEMKNKWELFIKKDILDKEGIREVIYDSWIRSKGYNINPYGKNISNLLSRNEFFEKKREFLPLLQTAKPFMTSLYDTIENPNIMIRLIDREGYVLDHIGEDVIIKLFNPSAANDGYSVKEEVIGTNAIGLAMITGEAAQVVGVEHYLKEYHEWTSSACPIRDYMGDMLGVLSITARYNDAHPHTLGMVVAAAEAIENELKLEESNKKLRMANEGFYQIMESISEGIIRIDNAGYITTMNRFARKLLGFSEDEMLNKNIKYIIPQEKIEEIMGRIYARKKYEEEEVSFNTKSGRKKTCIVNITPIKLTSSTDLAGSVITFREKRVVHSLVNKIVGANARFTFDDILGESEAIIRAKKTAIISASTDLTILLQGESGTGKEMFAQAIHNESKRKNNPFVFLNCGAIPRDLVSSELFGYVEGAFTGSKKGGHPGKFELADGGTIFLDEIGDMPLDSQTNLLRVLEDRKVVRVGGHELIPIDVRVIAATNKDLLREVEMGNFRRDLYYRLNVMPIYTPNVRDRKEDIRILIGHFLEKFSMATDKKIKRVEESFYDVMYNYDWPGNVREIQNVMQVILNFAENNCILTWRDAPFNIKSKSKSSKTVKEPLLTLDEIEKSAIERTILEVGGNMQMAAKVLGIGRSTLYRKMEKYNIG